MSAESYAAWRAAHNGGDAWICNRCGMANWFFGDLPKRDQCAVCGRKVEFP